MEFLAYPSIERNGGDFYAKSIGCVPGSLFDGLWVRICNDRAFCYGNKEQQRRFDGAGDGEYTV